MSRMRGADIVVEYLIREKVPYVFGLCGHGNIGMKSIEAMRVLTTMPTCTAKDQNLILRICVDRSQGPRRHKNNQDRECLHA